MPTKLKPVPPFKAEAEERRFLETLGRIKVAADKRDVPYQSLIKTWLAEKMDGA